MDLGPAAKETLTSALAKFEQLGVRRIALAIAIPIFAGGLYLAVRDYPVSFADLRLKPFLLSLVLGVPAIIALLTADFILQARFSGAKISFLRALEVVVVGNAANMLPIPGGAAIRVAAVKTHGGTLRRGAYSVPIFFGQQLGIGFLYAGGWLFAGFDTVSGGVLLGLGLVIATICSAMLYLLAAKPSMMLLGASLLTKILLVSIAAVVALWSLEAIGVPVHYPQAAIFVVAGMIGTLIWVVPGGLGVQEAVSAALAPLVGLSPAEGFLAATAQRCASLIAFLPLAIYFLRAREPGHSALRGRELRSDLEPN